MALPRRIRWSLPTPAPMLSGPRLWLSPSGPFWQDYDRTTLAGAENSPVAAWDDVSGNGFHALQASAGLRGVLRLGVRSGRRAVRFSGGSYLRVPYAAGQPLTRFVVLLSRSDPGVVLADGGPGGGGKLVFQSPEVPSIDAGVTLSGTAVSTGEWHVWRATFDGANSKIFLNGGSVTAGNAGTKSVNGITLGSASDGTLFADCDIGEVLEYNRALSDAEVTQTLAFLNSRWQLF